MIFKNVSPYIIESPAPCDSIALTVFKKVDNDTPYFGRPFTQHKEHSQRLLQRGFVNVCCARRMTIPKYPLLQGKISFDIAKHFRLYYGNPAPCDSIAPTIFKKVDNDTPYIGGPFTQHKEHSQRLCKEAL